MLYYISYPAIGTFLTIMQNNFTFSVKLYQNATTNLCQLKNFISERVKLIWV